MVSFLSKTTQTRVGLIPLSDVCSNPTFATRREGTSNHCPERQQPRLNWHPLSQWPTDLRFTPLTDDESNWSFSVRKRFLLNNRHQCCFRSVIRIFFSYLRTSWCGKSRSSLVHLIDQSNISVTNGWFICSLLTIDVEKWPCTLAISHELSYYRAAYCIDACLPTYMIPDWGLS